VTPPQSAIQAVRKRVTSRLIPADPNRKGCSYAVVLITPIDRPQTVALSNELSKLGHGKASPFYSIPDVQFARWIVIDQLLTDWKGAPKPPPILKSPYLLFSADLTAPAYRADRLPDSFFRELAARNPAVCKAVWGKCLGCPDVHKDRDKFVDYLTDSQIKVGLYYAAFPDLTAEETAAALELREQLARFARDHQDEMLRAPGAPGTDQAHQNLQTAYLTESATWGP
jgi:hypothetical protein